MFVAQIFPVPLKRSTDDTTAFFARSKLRFVVRVFQPHEVLRVALLHRHRLVISALNDNLLTIVLAHVRGCVESAIPRPESLRVVADRAGVVTLLAICQPSAIAYTG